jgi:hypothetical protein
VNDPGRDIERRRFSFPYATIGFDAARRAGAPFSRCDCTGRGRPQHAAEGRAFHLAHNRDCARFRRDQEHHCDGLVLSSKVRTVLVITRSAKGWGISLHYFSHIPSSFPKKALAVEA